MEVDAVQQRARQPRLVVFRAARRAGAGQFREMAAAARVHRCDQLKSRRISSVPLGAGDGHAAGLERLPQRLEGSAVELRQLVEKQHALMGQRNLARPGARSAADESRQ